MISRPPSVSSVRDSINTNIEISVSDFFRKNYVKTEPIKFANKTTLPKSPVVVKPTQALIGPVKDVISKTNDKPLTAVATAVLRNKQPITPAATAVLNTKLKEANKPKLPPKPIKNPPTVSLIKSIAQSKPITKKQAAAVKADTKKKQEEEVLRWRNKDVEMIAPVVMGKRKKETNLISEAKTKKEN